MPRGPLSEEKKKENVLAKVAEFLGKEPEEFIKEVTPLEISDDFMREAQSSLDYFNSRGAGFKTKICKRCEEPFSYSWNVDSIAYCSIYCMSKALEAIGLKWDPYKPPMERWGKTVPKVVPSPAKKILDELITDERDDVQEDQPLDTSQ